MTKFASRQAYLDNNTNVLLLDNITKSISPSDARGAHTNLFDTLIGYSQTVANIAALNALDLVTDFKENDIIIVTDIGEGAFNGVYKYIPAYLSSVYAWVRIGRLGNNQMITSTESSLADYIANEWVLGDLAVWDIVKIVGGNVYLLTTGTGSVVGNYQQIIYASSSGQRYTVATTAARDALVLGTDYEIGDFCLVENDGTGVTANYKYMYDDATSAYKWCCTGKWSDVVIS